MLDVHREFLNNMLATLRADRRIDAVLGAGSLIEPGLDRWSDLDLVLVVADDAWPGILSERRELAQTLGPLLQAFTGEHVGEPRLLIALFQHPDLTLLHVDLKFVTLDDLDRRVETPVILWARDEAVVQKRLDQGRVGWPNRSADWFEARAWVWLHYGATKMHRGEFFEALGMLAFLRDQVLGPMMHRRLGRNQRGVRRLESLDHMAPLLPTVAAHDRTAIERALQAAAELYVDLRSDEPPEEPTANMPALFHRYLNDHKHP